jgi:putative phosphotransacetylase
MTPAISREEVEKIVRKVVLDRIGPSTNNGGKALGPTLAVHASARHMHLCKADLEKLFGAGHELTVDRPLYQPGNYAAKETVTLVGPRSRLISNLRVLGPLRDRSQVELAFTDIISLGIPDVPVRISGDIDNTPGCVIMGPKGIVELKEGVIRAAIHVHMGPSDAEYYRVKHKDIMKLRIGGDAGVTFNRVHVRVDPTVRLNVHMDTDEANGCGLHLAKEFELIK